MENTYDPIKSYLASSGQQFSQANIKSLADSKGVAGYIGTDAQNKQLAGLLQPTPLAATMPVSTNVNANNLIQSNPIQLPSTPVSSVPVVPVSTPDRILNQMGIDEQTNTQVVQKDIIGKKLEALMGLTGESAALAAEQEKAGVARLKGELQNINSQILTKQAEIQQDDITLISKLRNEERRDTLLPFAQMGQAKIQGDAAIYRALKTSEIGVLNATAIAKQGDIQLAKETAQEAVDVKFAPYKEQIKQYDAILEAISPLLSRDEKIQAQKQQIRGQVAMKEIDKEAANDKQLNDMLIQASSQNAPASLVAKAKLAKTPSEAAMILGVYSGDYLDRQVKLAQLAKIGIETQKIKNEMGGNGTPKFLSPEDLAKFNSTPEVKALNAGVSYAKAVAEYKNAINKYGTGETFGAGSGVLGETYKALVGATKDYYSLGSYDNGVEKLIALGIPEPSLMGSSASRIAALDTSFKTALDSVKTSSNQLLKTTYANSVELENKLNDVAALGMTQMTNQDLLNQLPGTAQTYGSNAGVSNTDFFNKPN